MPIFEVRNKQFKDLKYAAASADFLAYCVFLSLFLSIFRFVKVQHFHIASPYVLARTKSDKIAKQRRISLNT